MRSKAVNTVLSAPAQIPALGQFPETIADLPEPHRVILALVVAHREATGGVVSWQELLDDTVVAISNPELLPAARSLSVADRNIQRTVTSVVGDLFDYDLLRNTGDGLDLSERAEQARHMWNGEFTDLTQEAKGIVTHAS
jgi:hypothetical protein